jgi:CRISPR-associated protein Csd1
VILQALNQLAQAEKLMEDPDFEWKPVAWLLRVGDGGEFLGFTSTQSAPPEETGRRKPRRRPKSFRVPREGGRTSGDRAFLLVDKAEYCLGRDPSGERPAEKLAARFALFRDRVDRCLASTDDPGVAAVRDFLARLAAGSAAISLPAGCAANDLFGFVYAPDADRLVTDRSAVRRYWEQIRKQEPPSGDALCLVTGEPCTPTDKHPLLKRVPGGTSSGVALVSFNSSAFESHGWSGNDNAPISRQAAEACGTALNRLLDPAFPDPQEPGATLPPRHLRLAADTVVCFWSSEPRGDDFLEALGLLLDGNPDQVKEVYRSIWTGRWRPAEASDLSRGFYALTLSGAQGRAVVRDWFESSVAEVAGNLARHFRDLDLVRTASPPKGRDEPPPLALRTLLRSLAFAGDEKRIPPSLAGQIVGAALRGTVYPLQVLQRAVERARVETGRASRSDLERRDARASLIKAVLNRRRRFRTNATSYPEVTRAMDDSNDQDGYLLGRLMAVIEEMQRTALGEIGATVVDRYFAAASATPGTVFPRLLRGFRHHSRKAREDADRRKGGKAGWLEEQANRILAGLSLAAREACDQWIRTSRGALKTPARAFPSFLPLEQQGLFVLGYHHQRHYFFIPKEEKTRRASQQGAEETTENRATGD